MTSLGQIHSAETEHVEGRRREEERFQQLRELVEMGERWSEPSTFIGS